jgi:hypothetical protein
MSRARSQLRHGVGMWPDGLASTSPAPELTPAAKRLAESVLDSLNRAGVSVTLDEAGRAKFRSMRFTPPAARRAIEVHGDLIESFLRAKESSW